MNRAWAASIENLWHSPSLPMWLTLAAAGFFAVVLLVTLFRAERSLANGALTVITLLAIGIAVATMMRASGGAAGSAADMQPAAAASSALPALACLDGLAGESVENACEKALFASPDSVAAAVSYTAAQVSRLAAAGNASAGKALSPELSALRRTVERDRYGLVAQVLMTREGCTAAAPCPFFQSLTNPTQIASNMNERLYDGFVGRYAPSWNTAAATPAAAALATSGAPVAALPPGTVAPPGKPVSGDFPSAASIPPINIMTPEPAAQGTQSAARPADNAAAAAAHAPAPKAAPPPAAKKAAPQKSRVQAPVQLAPPPPSDDN
jgi:hypothetical protein